MRLEAEVVMEALRGLRGALRRGARGSGGGGAEAGVGAKVAVEGRPPGVAAGGSRCVTGARAGVAHRAPARPLSAAAAAADWCSDSGPSRHWAGRGAGPEEEGGEQEGAWGGERGGRALAQPAPPPLGPAEAGEGNAGGGLTAPEAVAGLSRPQKSGDQADSFVRVKRDMAARPTSPGGLVCTGKGRGYCGAATTFPRGPRAGRGGGKEAPRVQCAGVSRLWLYKGGFGATCSFASSTLSLLQLRSSVSPPVSSHPGNQGLLLYVVCAITAYRMDLGGRGPCWAFKETTCRHEQPSIS
ncbi:spidroin-1-like [Mesoplodon densirostris]|uniref:spidroin-1-like n=1 Tax=Mesoplodon densirostris TaxID=48708 RepID=UPI0028DCD027|nr:spidroin-1-like [Mesoplodon densirostris]